MEFLAIVLLAGVTFGICYLLDKGFEKIFRNQAQHHSGLAVRLNKKYGAFGLIFIVLGAAALLFGTSEGWLLPVCGVIVGLIGVGLVVYYMTFGVFYDKDSFVLTTFGKRSTTYHYRDIRCQQLYNSYGSIVIELEMTDGRTVHLQSGMSGVYAFMDKAFEGWCVQRGIQKEACDFYDPDNSCWFPNGEVK